MGSVRYKHASSSVSVGGSCCKVERTLGVGQLKKSPQSSSTCAVSHRLSFTRAELCMSFRLAAVARSLTPDMQGLSHQSQMEIAPSHFLCATS